ncbi:hypothetical protein [Fluviibacterium sp. S390]|uniref:hypothetical protein n=1 Tax=Fluviibacterium sp. S390 TaxID=3415139 RepID=UPI003C7C5E31
MTVIIVGLSVLCFIAAFQVLNLVPRARTAIATSRATAAVMGDKSLDEDAKEAAVQKAALSLMKNFLDLLIRGALTLVAAWVPIQAADMIGLKPADETMAFMLRLDVILITSVIVTVAVIIGLRVAKK